jgi:hypothetical protein
MSVPHGAELSVFTPNGRALVVVPFEKKGSHAAGEGFPYVARYTLATATVTGRISPMAQPERVFRDSGLYLLRVSEEAEISGSQVCKVRVQLD